MWTSSKDDSVVSLLLPLCIMLADGWAMRQQQSTYRVHTQPRRIIFHITIILKVGIEHFGCIRHWSWRQRLHVEECISGHSLLEHLDTRVDRRDWRGRLIEYQYRSNMFSDWKTYHVASARKVGGGYLE